MNLLHTSESGKDRRLNFLLAAAVLTAVAMLVFGVIATPKILSSASTTQALDENAEIGGCRAAYRTTLIDTPEADLLVAKARLDERTNAGLEALVRGDEEAVLALLDQSPTLAELRTELVLAAESVTSGVDAYLEVVELSQVDPAGFLVQCREESP